MDCSVADPATYVPDRALSFDAYHFAVANPKHRYVHWELLFAAFLALLVLFTNAAFDASRSCCQYFWDQAGVTQVIEDRRLNVKSFGHLENFPVELCF